MSAAYRNERLAVADKFDMSDFCEYIYVPVSKDAFMKAVREFIVSPLWAEIERPYREMMAAQMGVVESLNIGVEAVVATTISNLDEMDIFRVFNREVNNIKAGKQPSSGDGKYFAAIAEYVLNSTEETHDHYDERIRSIDAKYRFNRTGAYYDELTRSGKHARREAMFTQFHRFHPKLQERIFNAKDFAIRVFDIPVKQQKCFRESGSLNEFIASQKVIVDRKVEEKRKAEAKQSATIRHDARMANLARSGTCADTMIFLSLRGQFGDGVYRSEYAGETTSRLSAFLPPELQDRETALMCSDEGDSLLY